MTYVLTCCVAGVWYMIQYFFSCTKELPAMAKLFVKSVKCPTCRHAKDFDVRFGYKRKFKTTPVEHHSHVVVNLDEIEARLQQSLNYDQATSYKKH